MKYLIQPWQHQLQAIDRASKTDEFALFFEMGCGKTSTAINILRDKYFSKKRLLRTLILCPPIVIDNWKKEFLAHSAIQSHDIIPLTKAQKVRCEHLKTFGFKLNLREEPMPAGKIVITNYEAMQMLDLVRLLHKWKPEVIICDESHRCKDPRAKRTKTVLEFSLRADFRYLLTGTPILNSAMDIFSQFYILDKGETFGKNFFTFRAKYFYDKNAGMPAQRHFPDWQIRPKSLEQINKLVAKKSMRVTKAECLDLPPLVVQNIRVELTTSQKKLYDDMKKNFIAYLGHRYCVANLAITKGLRLMQIASGFLNVEGVSSGDPRKNIQLEDNPRAKALEELLREITPNSKVLVWAVFKENYQTIRDACKIVGADFVEVHGEISAAQKQENVETFNNNEKCRVLIGHPGSGGIGINLVAASYSIFYSRNFSLEQDLQAEARNHRGGSEIHAKITRINLIGKDTIDEIITDALAKKISISDTVLKELLLEKTETPNGS